MRNKNHIRTNNRRTIGKAFPRFVSLMVMSLLGVFVFAGLMATAPDMIETLDRYLDDSNGYDLRIISDMGLMAEDIEAIEAIDGIEYAIGGKTLDIIVEDGETQVVVQCNIREEGINDPEVIKGRLPKQNHEIAVETAMLENCGYKIGDKITTESSALKEQTLTIVGEVKSPLYFNCITTASGRGNTSVGKGKIDYYAYIREDNLDFDYYTVIYAKVDGAKELTTSEDDYVELVDKLKLAVEDISTSREQARYDALIANANKQIDDAEAEAYQKLDDQWAELEPLIQQMVDGKQQLEDADQQLVSSKEELDDAKQQLDSAQKELEDAGAKLSDTEKKLAVYADELATSKEKLDAAEKQLKESRSELDSYKRQLDNAKTQLDSAKAQLTSSKATLDENEKKLASAKAELDAAEQQLASARAELDAGWAQYNSALESAGLSESELSSTASTLDSSISALKRTISEADNQIASIDARLAELDDSTYAGAAQKRLLEAERQALVSTRDRAQSNLDTLQTQRDGITQLQNAKAQLDAGEAEYSAKKAQYDAALAQYNAGKSEWEAGKAQYDAGVKDYESGLAQYNSQKAQYEAAEQAYQSGLKEYEAGKKKYEEGKSQYDAGNKEYQSGKAQYESAKSEYESGKKKYEEGLAAYEMGVADYESGMTAYEENLNKYKDSADYSVELIDLDQDFESMEEAEALYQEARADIASQIEETRGKLDDIKMPNWYVYDRTGYNIYGEYLDASNSIRNLAGIFPPIFFAVAVLVSLISMNRMVEEDRMEIGTMKSLGFDNRHIMSKYLCFSLLATLTGGLIGGLSGLYIIPKMIFNIYRLLFELPDLTVTLQPFTTCLGFVITVLCVCGTSILTVNLVLKEKPSELMRPKAPKNGKRVLLERIPFIWHNLSFSKKVTVRNLSRYKKRVMITIGGIAGCTVLMLTGFGIRDSIMDLPEAQYEDVYRFEGTAIVSQLVAEDFSNQEGILGAHSVQQISATAADQNAYLFIAEDADSLAQVVNLRDHESGELIRLEEGKIIVTEKFAALGDLKVGDRLDIVDVDNNSYDLEISGIVDNYVYHYIYMSKATYENFGHRYTPNMVYFNTGDITEEQENVLAEQLLETGHVLAITFKNSQLRSIAELFGSLNSVVVILLVLAALLSFVVLYNLANININERRREIATLKVLGFYDKEVDDYITKETIIMTAVGIAIGLTAGVFVSHAVVLNIEISVCRFINHVQPISFVYTALFAILFTWIVNMIIHFNLKKINMIDSLKCVE